MGREEKNNFIDTLNRLVPEEKHKLKMIATLFGCSATIIDYLKESEQIKTMPDIVKYACALISGNMLAIISDGVKGKFIDMTEEDTDYKMSEQTQERIYRRMKQIIMELYEYIQEKENI